jgi:hypothetical protein
MSFASYTQFTASVASWLDIGTSDIGASVYSDLVTVSETRIFREVRVREMETSFSSSISSGLLALPTSYLALKSAWVDRSPQVTLERRPAEWIRANYPQTSDSGIPQFIGRYGGNFIFGPYPDSAYTVQGIYYKKPTAISGAALTTFFSDNPDLYLFCCLAESEILIGRDARIPIWEAKYQRILSDLNGMDKAEEHSGSTLQIRANGLGAIRMR